MKKKSTLTLLVLAAAFGLSITKVFTYAQDPPSGRTGAPTEGTCRDCHGDFNLNSGGGSVSITVKDSAGNTVTQYTPGKQHTIVISTAKSGAKNFGFEATVRVGTSSTMAGSFPSTSTSDVTYDNNEYAKQKSASSQSSWTFMWTAPPKGKGDLTVYASSNCGNNDGNDGGDYIYTSSKKLTENTSSSIEENAVATGLKIYPNPVKDFLNLNFILAKNAKVEANIVTLNGAVVQRLYLAGKDKGTHNLHFKMDDMPAGIYMLQLNVDGINKYERIVKL